jgi:ATP-dependent RNA helicase RhlE
MGNFFMPPTNFDNLGIAPKILEILSKLNFQIPTPIQHQSIPIAIEGKDVMGIAQTGTGKTLAFGIPIIQRLATNKGKGLIILPTRELAMQVDESLKKIGKFLGLRTAILIGGENIGKQIRQLRNNPHIIIATPGRLIDHLEQKTITLNTVAILVLDEADRMLDMGFAPQIKKILNAVPAKRQTMLFSATMPEEIVNIAKSYMQYPVRVEVAPAGSTVAKTEQELFFVRKENKLSLLQNILKESKGSVLIFTRTKFGAKKLANSIRNLGHTAAEIHSNRSQNQRVEALEGFKIGKYRVLVATDIAARGIDVLGITLVINYDLPQAAEDYVHRIGRTGRANHEGRAVSFATLEQKFEIRTIERLIKKQLPVSKTPAGLEGQPALEKNHSSFGGFRSPNRQPRESFGHRGQFRPMSQNPKPLRSPYAKSKSSVRSQPHHSLKGGNAENGYFIKKKNFRRHKSSIFG